jgi:hypothetical protein
MRTQIWQNDCSQIWRCLRTCVIVCVRELREAMNLKSPCTCEITASCSIAVRRFLAMAREVAGESASSTAAGEYCGRACGQGGGCRGHQASSQPRSRAPQRDGCLPASTARGSCPLAHQRQWLKSGCCLSLS